MTTVYAWLESALKRVYPSSWPAGGQSPALLTARGWRVAFQACVRNLAQGACNAHLRVIDASGLPVHVRRVGYVPVAHLSTETAVEELEGVGHIPGYVPDPLFPGDTTVVGPQETRAFWITVQVPAEVEPGLRELTLRMEVDGKPLPLLRFTLDVQRLVVAPRKGLPATHWFYADALCDWYHLEPFEDRFWQVVRPYMLDLVEHGINCQYVPIFTPPTDPGSPVWCRVL